jgi:copper(I)-binding protein
MKSSSKPIAVALLLLAASLGSALAAAANVHVSNARARATVPGQTTAVVYMDITSEADSALVSATSPVAERVEVHSMTMDGGIMRMRPVPKLELKGGKTVRLGPDSMHLMLVNVKRPLKAGETVALTLRLGASAGAVTTIEVQAPVVPITDSASHHHKH